MMNQECCLKTMSKMEDNSIDLIITSPPYNKRGLSGGQKISNQIWTKFNIDYEGYDDNMNEQDYKNFMITCLNEMHRIIKPSGSIMFNHKPRRHNNITNLPTEFIHKTNCNLYQMIIWNRKNSPNIRKDILLPCLEHVYWFCKQKPKCYKNLLEPEYRSEIWNISPDKQKNHPAPFPIKLVENLILLASEENDIVYDPFAGIGTVLSVANSLNRKTIGSEISEKYCSIYNNGY